MRFVLDQYAHLDSPIHRWDPRFKLIGFLLLIFAFSFVRDLYLLPALVLLTALILAVAQLPGSFVLARWRYPSLFLIAVVILLPFLSGSTVLAALGPVEVYQEGIRSTVLIAVRFLSILTLGIVLFGTASFVTTVRAMRSLGLPVILADVILLSFRYIFELGDYLHRMETALRLRGFRARRLSLRGIGTLAWLGGSILVRSYERSEWVYRAMLLRGYGQAGRPRNEFRATRSDAFMLGAFCTMAAALIVGQVLL